MTNESDIWLLTFDAPMPNIDHCNRSSRSVEEPLPMRLLPILFLGVYERAADCCGAPT
jgi:hypothetical protein